MSIPQDPENKYCGTCRDDLNGRDWEEEGCTSAALFGHLECLKFAFENGSKLTKATASSAAKSGSVECLQFIHDNKGEWDEFTAVLAAFKGSVDCLRYAHENKCPWNKSVPSTAAAHNNLECLKYCHENGCPWDKDTTKRACEITGGIECLKYAYENGCPMTSFAILVALKSNKMDCAEYIVKNAKAEEYDIDKCEAKALFPPTMIDVLKHLVEALKKKLLPQKDE